MGPLASSRSTTLVTTGRLVEGSGTVIGGTSEAMDDGLGRKEVGTLATSIRRRIRTEGIDATEREAAGPRFGSMAKRGIAEMGRV